MRRNFVLKLKAHGLSQFVATADAPEGGPKINSRCICRYALINEGADYSHIVVVAHCRVLPVAPRAVQHRRVHLGETIFNLLISPNATRINRQTIVVIR